MGGRPWHGMLGASVAYTGLLSHFILNLSVVAVWVAYARSWRRITWFAIALPWLCLLVLLRSTMRMFALSESLAV